MPTFAFTPPFSPGQCAVPAAITPSEVAIDFLSVGVLTVGLGQTVLVSDVDWFLSDTLGSGRTILVAAFQPVVLPLSFGMRLSASTVSGSGTLYCMLTETVAIHVTGVGPPASTFDFSDTANSQYIPLISAFAA